MNNRTEAISSATASFRMVNYKTSTNDNSKQVGPENEPNSISDTLATSDSEADGGSHSQHASENDGKVPPRINRAADNDDGTGNILDVSG